MTVIRLDGDAFGRRIGIHVVLLLSLSDGAAVKEEEGRNKLAANFCFYFHYYQTFTFTF